MFWMLPWTFPGFTFGEVWKRHCVGSVWRNLYGDDSTAMILPLIILPAIYSNGCHAGASWNPTLPAG